MRVMQGTPCEGSSVTYQRPTLKRSNILANTKNCLNLSPKVRIVSIRIEISQFLSVLSTAYFTKQAKMPSSVKENEEEVEGEKKKKMAKLVVCF